MDFWLDLLTFRFSSVQSWHSTDLNVAFVRDLCIVIQSSHTTIPSSTEAHTGSVKNKIQISNIFKWDNHIHNHLQILHYGIRIAAFGNKILPNALFLN